MRRATPSIWPAATPRTPTPGALSRRVTTLRHGQPNGVVLETGGFFHMRPHGMTQVGLGIGAKVSAVGGLLMTVLGTRLLEARQVNRVELA